MSNLRNAQLLQQMQAHPLKATLARCLDLAEIFQGDVEFLSLDKNLSPQGRQNAMQAKLRAAIRDLRDAKAPLSDLQKKLDQKRAAVSMPKFDPSDVVGFLRRQEVRAALRNMDAGQRALTLNDPMFIDAVLELPPSLSGFVQGEQLVIDAAAERRLAGMFGPQLEEIAALEQTVAEARSIADIAQNDLKLHSAMDDRQFTEFVKPIESKQNAPWLRRDKDFDGNERIIVIDLANPEGPVGKPATADQIRDGKYYRDFAEYSADRAA